MKSDHAASRPTRRWPLVLVAALGAAVVALGPGVGADEGGYVGDESCAMCHEDVAAAFAGTPHAVAHGWDAEKGCESCHGPGEAHVDAGGTAETMSLPTELAAKESSAVCLQCHTRQQQHFSYKQSFHYLGDVACSDCHNPHGDTENLLVAQGKELCAQCHQVISSQFDLARAHPIDKCSDCHPPHATRSLRTDTTLFRQVCTDCHFEKQGPFVYDHDVMMVDGCVSCHEVHGAPNRHLLKHEPQVNLCYQCHSASVTPGWHSAPRFLNEKCTACHTAIHGSNTNPFFLEE